MSSLERRLRGRLNWAQQRLLWACILCILHKTCLSLFKMICSHVCSLSCMKINDGVCKYVRVWFTLWLEMTAIQVAMRKWLPLWEEWAKGHPGDGLWVSRRTRKPPLLWFFHRLSWGLSIRCGALRQSKDSKTEHLLSSNVLFPFCLFNVVGMPYAQWKSPAVSAVMWC